MKGSLQISGQTKTRQYQISEEKTILSHSNREWVIDQLRRPELCEESELESSIESDTAKDADVKVLVTSFKSRQVTECEVNVC